jgi:hypothetical protein
VQRVRCADMDRVDGLVPKDALVVNVGRFDFERFGQFPSRLKSTTANGGNFDRTKPLESFQMDASHEAGTDNGGSQTHHAADGCSLKTI